MNEPETRYAKTIDGVSIAYQVRGEGPVDLVFIMGFASNFEVETEEPRAARFADRLASFSRLILFDKRGSGLSDHQQTPDLEMRVDDLRAVLDAVGSERAVLYGESEGGTLAAFFAATHPDRVSALVLYGSQARYAWAPDYPMGMTREAFLADQRSIGRDWGTMAAARTWAEREAPSLANDEAYLRWSAKCIRYGASPAAALAFNEIRFGTDIRSILGSVQAPTLVMWRAAGDWGAGDQQAARFLADRIPGAKYVELPGSEYWPRAGNMDEFLDTVEGFVHSIRAEQASIDRVLATVLFTDIVDSTERAAGIGDAEWKVLLERHHQTVRAMIGRYRGSEIDTTGDGFLATFDGPARGVKCAQAIAEAVQPLGLEIRAGLHTGEVEMIDGKVGGLAVHIGARVGASAGPSEVFVSQTVKDLVAGSGLAFEDAGEHELKGVPTDGTFIGWWADVDTPRTRYAKTVDGVHIAYQVRGSGPVDLVYASGYASNFEVELEEPHNAAYFAGLSSFARLILFDKRGTGLSDRTQTPDLEMRADDLRAVLDAVDADRAVLLGDVSGGALAMFFAATYPERVQALVLFGAYARGAWAPDYPIGQKEEDFLAERADTEERWGTIELAQDWIDAQIPSLAHDRKFVESFAKALRHGASPAAAVAFEDVLYTIDVRAILGSVQAPTLVLATPGMGDLYKGTGDVARERYVADRIPGSRYVELPGRDFGIALTNPQLLLDQIERFIRSVSTEEAEIDRVLATILFTDIVGSTDKAVELGDSAWRDLLRRHHEVVRAMIGRYRGKEVDTAGDGFFATFDGPARGVRCAKAIVEAIHPLGIEIRAGLHTGEIALEGDEVQGIAVHIGARVGALAQPSEVLVSQTVKDLVAGSGLTFEDAGEHELKGVPDRWRLYRVVD